MRSRTYALGGSSIKPNPDTGLAAEMPEYKSRCKPTCSSVSPSSGCKRYQLGAADTQDSPLPHPALVDLGIWDLRRCNMDLLCRGRCGIALAAMLTLFLPHPLPLPRPPGGGEGKGWGATFNWFKQCFWSRSRSQRSRAPLWAESRPKIDQS